MQQDLEDKKNEVIIEGLEKKIKDQEAALEKKDFVLQTVEGSLVEAQAKVARLNSELSLQSKNFEQEKKDFETKLVAKAEKSSNLQKSLKDLQEKCLGPLQHKPPYSNASVATHVFMRCKKLVGNT
jgi:hypothetical protein